jgi:ADP-glucose pyrophosphorylase
VDTTILGLDAASAAEQPYIASMGIYVCKASTLQDLLSKTLRWVGGLGVWGGRLLGGWVGE